MSFFQYLKSKEFLRTIISVLVLIVILIFGLMKWLDNYTKHDEKVKVPNLEQLSLSETQVTLQNLKLNFVVIDSASFNPKFPPKSVIEQDPIAGDFVKENRKIYVTLNPSGYRKIAIPNFVEGDQMGSSKKGVVIHLKSLGFRIGKDIYIAGENKDVVRGLEANGKKVNPDDKLSKNTIINLVLEKGTEKRDSLRLAKKIQELHNIQ
ncbi:MAG: serine/threonine protein kinase [Bacteroidetes bacterium]|nr:MAG: serine/threonine protein kinase [Bacteroidota bacterium]